MTVKLSILQSPISKAIVLLSAIIFALCSCADSSISAESNIVKSENISNVTEEKFMDILISDSQQNINELVKTKYSHQELDEISNADCTIQELNNRYPIEVMRKYSDYFKVVYSGENEYLILYYDLSGNPYILPTQVSPIVSKSAIYRIEIGSDLKEVQDLDPSAFFYFLYTGDTTTPKISQHYTIDGYYCEVKYNEDLKVVAINSELI